MREISFWPKPITPKSQTPSVHPSLGEGPIVGFGPIVALGPIVAVPIVGLGPIVALGPIITLNLYWRSGRWL